MCPGGRDGRPERASRVRWLTSGRIANYEAPKTDRTIDSRPTEDTKEISLFWILAVRMCRVLATSGRC